MEEEGEGKKRTGGGREREREEKITSPPHTMIFASDIDDFANIREEKNRPILTQGTSMCTQCVFSVKECYFASAL